MHKIDVKKRMANLRYVGYFQVIQEHRNGCSTPTSYTDYYTKCPAVPLLINWADPLASFVLVFED